MQEKCISYAAMTIDNKCQQKEADGNKKPNSKTNIWNLLWEVELTDEQRNRLGKQIEEDTKLYKEQGKKVVKDKSD